MQRPVLFLALSLAAGHAAESFSFHHENVLGTSLELKLTADSAAVAAAAEKSVLAEVDRLAAVLSTWRPDSEIRRWQDAATLQPVSPDLAAVLKACDHWTGHSQGAFNVRPSSPESAQPAWRIEGGSALYLAKPGEITVDALAKGYIIDRALEKAAAPGISRIVLNIGGDLRVRGEGAEPVRIADPRNAAENAAPLATVSVENRALATSGGYRRGPHLIDPRTRRPAEGIASASVLAPDAVTADALATVFSILEPSESLRLADSLPGVACLLVTTNGVSHPSRDWKSEPAVPAAAAAGVPMELTLEFEINRPEAERYQRPYVAVWLADKDGKLVRTISLWFLNNRKGTKWLPRLKRWNRADAEHRVYGQTPDIPPVSSATRQPGKYSVVWDGLDDQRNPLPAGDYTLYIEAVREHGTYQLISHPFHSGAGPFKAPLAGNEEIKSAALDYHLKPAAP